MEMVYLGVVLAPLIGAIIAGVFGKTIGRVNAHRVTITGVGIAFFLAFIAFWHIVVNSTYIQHPGMAEPFRIAPAEPVAYTNLVRGSRKSAMKRSHRQILRLSSTVDDSEDRFISLKSSSCGYTCLLLWGEDVVTFAIGFRLFHSVVWMSFTSWALAGGAADPALCSPFSFITCVM
jgi:hypothetical protein